MIFAYKKSALIFIVSSVCFFIVCAAAILDMYCFHMLNNMFWFVILSISLIILAVCMRLSLRIRKKLYNDSVQLCDRDLDAFLTEQDRVYPKVSKPNQAVVLLNKAHGLIAYEKYDQAQEVLKTAENHPFVQRSLHQQYLTASRFVTVYLRLQNYSMARAEIEKQRKITDKIAEKNPVMAQQYEKVVKNNLLICDVMEGIYSGNNVKEIAAEMYQNTERTYKSLSPDMWFYNYTYINSQYTMGLLSYTMGEKAQADKHFALAGKIKAEYPICRRLEKYLSDKDIKALIGM